MMFTEEKTYKALVNSTKLKEILSEIIVDIYLHPKGIVGENWKIKEDVSFNWLKNEIEKKLPFPYYEEKNNFPVLCRKVEAVRYNITKLTDGVEIGNLIITDTKITIRQYYQSISFIKNNTGGIFIEKMTTHCGGSVYPVPVGKILISYKDIELITTFICDKITLNRKISELEKENQNLKKEIEKLKLENKEKEEKIKEISSLEFLEKRILTFHYTGIFRNNKCIRNYRELKNAIKKMIKQLKMY